MLYRTNSVPKGPDLAFLGSPLGTLIVEDAQLPDLVAITAAWPDPVTACLASSTLFAG